MYRAKNEDPDTLDLLLQWREPVSSSRILRAVLGSLAVHGAVVALFLALPSPSTDYRGQLLTVDLRRAIPLVAPRLSELTQKDPNKDKVTNQLDASSALPPLPKARSFRAPAPRGPVSEPAAGALPQP
ncbi:MAG: hypothetical protein ACRD5L_18695, partial [Bryobacteraceae bacterium]